MKKLTMWCLLSVSAVALPALAHHSFAMFDNEREMTLVGTVKEFQWTNPHAWLQVMVPSADGKAIEWSIEMTSPNGLKRSGWRPTTIKAGDKVTAIIHPLKSGETGGSLVMVTLPDGKVMGRRVAPGQTPTQGGAP
jgi:hypothetical protein